MLAVATQKNKDLEVELLQARAALDRVTNEARQLKVRITRYIRSVI
jgi:hypothetical protein